MNKLDFMRQLESLLQDIPEQERVEALQYYSDYFEDAGVENEQAVMEALGNPARVAENIKRDLDQNRYGYSLEQEKVAEGKEIVKYQPQLEKVQSVEETEKPKKEGMSTGLIVLMVVLCILASPVLLGLLAGLLGVLVGVLAVWFSIIISFGAVALVLIVVAVILAVVGIMGMLSNPMAGAGILGGGLIVAAVGIGFMMLVVLMAGWATPAAVKGIIWIIRKLTGKNKTV